MMTRASHISQGENFTDLRARNTELLARITELRRQIADLSSAGEMIVAMDEQLQKFKVTDLAQRTEIDRLVGDLKEQCSENQLLQKKFEEVLQELEMGRHDFETRLREEKAELEMLRRGEEELHRECLGLNNALAASLQCVTRLEDGVASLERRLQDADTEAKRKMAKMSDEIWDKELKIEAQHEQYKSLATEFERLRIECSNRDQSASLLDQTLNDLKEKMRLKDFDIASEEKKYEELHASFSATLGAKDAEISFVREETAKIRNKLAAVLEEKSTELKNAHRLIQEQKKQHALIQSASRSKFDDAFTSARKTNESLSREVQRLRIEVSDYQKQLCGANDTVARLQKTLCDEQLAVIRANEAAEIRLYSAAQAHAQRLQLVESEKARMQSAYDLALERNRGTENQRVMEMAACTEEIHRRDGEIRKLVGKIADLESANRTNRNEIEEAKAKATKTETDFANALAEATAYAEKSKSDFATTLEASHSTEASLRREIRSMEDRRVQLESRLTDAHRKIHEQKEDLEHQANREAELTKNIESLVGERNHLEAMVREAFRTNESLQSSAREAEVHNADGTVWTFRPFGMSISKRNSANY